MRGGFSCVCVDWVGWSHSALGKGWGLRDCQREKRGKTRGRVKSGHRAKRGEGRVGSARHKRQEGSRQEERETSAHQGGGICPPHRHTAQLHNPCVVPARGRVIRKRGRGRWKSAPRESKKEGGIQGGPRARLLPRACARRVPCRQQGGGLPLLPLQPAPVAAAAPLPLLRPAACRMPRRRSPAHVQRRARLLDRRLPPLALAAPVQRVAVLEVHQLVCGDIYTRCVVVVAFWVCRSSCLVGWCILRPTLPAGGASKSARNARRKSTARSPKVKGRPSHRPKKQQQGHSTAATHAAP